MGIEGGGGVVFRYSRKKRSKLVEKERREGGGNGNGNGKACLDCRTTDTPLWRTGPSGPKTLCNACGIRQRKQRRKEGRGNSKHGRITPPLTPDEAEVLKQKQKRKQEELWLLLQHSRKFASTCGKEEAEAAVLLMALSTGLFVHS